MTTDQRVEELELQLRRLAQERTSLAQRAQRYRDILDRLPQAVCRLHPDGVFGFVNRACCEALGADLADLIGRNFLTTCRADVGQRCETGWQRLTPDAPTVEVACDGERGVLVWTFEGLFDTQGTLEGIQAYCHVSRRTPPAQAQQDDDTAEVPVVSAAASPGNAEHKILVVDDENMVCTLAQKVLERFGFQVLVAKTGQRALDTFKAHHPHISVVLLDMSLPDIDGQKVLDAMRQLQPEVRVVVSSGYDSLSHGLQNASHGVSFLPKPYMPDQLVSKVREMIDE